MSYDKVQVGNRIRGSRLEKGWTQERLAAEAEISVQQLRALETHWKKDSAIWE